MNECESDNESPVITGGGKYYRDDNHELFGGCRRGLGSKTCNLPAAAAGILYSSTTAGNYGKSDDNMTLSAKFPSEKLKRRQHF